MDPLDRPAPLFKFANSKIRDCACPRDICPPLLMRLSLSLSPHAPTAHPVPTLSFSFSLAEEAQEVRREGEGGRTVDDEEEEDKGREGEGGHVMRGNVHASLSLSLSLSRGMAAAAVIGVRVCVCVFGGLSLCRSLPLSSSNTLPSAETER